MPARQVENAVRRAHAAIWAGGKRDPLQAFDEWSKLLFAKLHDERLTKNGRRPRFQVGAGEGAVAVGNRIRALFEEARRADPAIFGEDLGLPDEKIREVVRIIEAIAFLAMDTDSLGAAFEGFFGSIFRGELGQYFTRREIARFVCALLEPDESDTILDPTAGSGGFLLESLLQVRRRFDGRAGGRRGHDGESGFTPNSLHGIEIHPVLGRLCQTNLLLHGGSHANMEVDRSCLDRDFSNRFLEARRHGFTMVVGNPPFGKAVGEGDRDILGNGRLSDFQAPGGKARVQSEIVIVERSIKWLVPGRGRLGMVVPDGLLNNGGEGSRCPALRRLLFTETKLLAIVSLPDYAFRKSGAQIKTSLLFLRRLSEAERGRMRASMRAVADATPEQALLRALRENDNPVFLAEAEHTGFTPAGSSSDRNDLYRRLGGEAGAADGTILGEYRKFCRDPERYPGPATPACMAVKASELFGAHESHRIDPKFHIFKRRERRAAPAGLEAHRLGRLLKRRREPVVPSQHPDREFQTITLTQQGEALPREPGKGNNPPAWHGAYFKEGQKWFVVRAGDFLVSRIDLWKGCIGVVPPELDGAVVTGEFPCYRLNPVFKDGLDVRYLKLLLKSRHFQKAIRAITTGHSNRRRTQESDFRKLQVFLPDKRVQEKIADSVARLEEEIGERSAVLAGRLGEFDRLLAEATSVESFQEFAVAL